MRLMLTSTQTQHQRSKPPHCARNDLIAPTECLRGELRSLKANVETLCRKVRDRHQNTSGTAAAHTPPPSNPQEDPAASAAMVLELEEEDGGGDPSTTTAAAEDAMGSFQREDLKLEVQVQSQFRLLWAVFQSHSTAEDEVIWPALKEKARSSGGKVRGRACVRSVALAFAVGVCCVGVRRCACDAFWSVAACFPLSRGFMRQFPLSRLGPCLSCCKQWYVHNVDCCFVCMGFLTADG